jgi:hypothetical protein
MNKRKQTNLFRDTTSVLNVSPQRLDTDLFPIEFRFVGVSETSRRDWLSPVRKPFARNEMGSWQNLTVAAGTLQSA